MRENLCQAVSLILTMEILLYNVSSRFPSLGHFMYFSFMSYITCADPDDDRLKRKQFALLNT